MLISSLLTKSEWNLCGHRNALPCKQGNDCCYHGYKRASWYINSPQKEEGDEITCSNNYAPINVLPHYPWWGKVEINCPNILGTP